MFITRSASGRLRDQAHRLWIGCTSQFHVDAYLQRAVYSHQAIAWRESVPCTQGLTRTCVPGFSFVELADTATTHAP
jgi:hypothetical protein